MTSENGRLQKRQSSEVFGYLGFFLALIASCLLLAASVNSINSRLSDGTYLSTLLVGAVAWLCFRKSNKE